MEVFKKHYYKIFLLLLVSLYLTPFLYNFFTPFGLCNGISISQALSCNSQEGFSIALEPIYFFQTIFSGSALLQTVGIVWLVTYSAIFLIVFFTCYYIFSFIVLFSKKRNKQRQKK